jgi:ParB-like chromosome segregation protein Spo0J
MRAPVPLIEQTYDVVPIDQLSQHPDNPRKGDVELIASSIDANGFYGAVIAQRSTGHVLAGNHRLLAARARDIEHLPVVWVDVDDDRALRIMAVDNRSNDVAEYDEQRLIELLQGFDHDYRGTGFTETELAAMLAAEPDAGSLQLEEQALSIIVECDDEQQQHTLLERFAQDGLTCRPLMM